MGRGVGTDAAGPSALPQPIGLEDPEQGPAVAVEAGWKPVNRLEPQGDVTAVACLAEEHFGAFCTGWSLSTESTLRLGYS